MRALYPDAPDEADNDVREDGTACHWLAKEIWERRIPAEGSLSPNNRVLDDEMFDAVDLYHGVLRQSAWQDGETYIEQPIDCSLIYPKMQGTPDAFTVIARGEHSNGRLRVVDLKYGFRFVEVWDNLQLIIYALCIAWKLELPDDYLVELTIVQPRSYHRDGPVRSWTTTVGNLRAKYLQMLRDAANAAMGGAAPPCTPNPGCVDCAARFSCVALQNAALRAVEQAYMGIPLELPPSAIGMELTILKAAERALEARIAGLTMQAESLIRNGKVVPGWTIAPTYARERWQDGAEAHILTLASKYFDVDASKPTQAVSPARARKLGIPDKIVAMFSHKPSTGVKLAKQDPNEAKKAFQSTAVTTTE